MKLKQYIVDSFADELFSGNQAAVCILHERISDDLMQKITIENNFSETAFAMKTGEGRYSLRWFTPADEINLCGHATLATAFVLMTEIEPSLKHVEFDTLSGLLTVDRNGEWFRMNFPQQEYHEIPVTDDMEKALGIRPSEAYLGRDLLMVLPSEEAVKTVSPKEEDLLKLPGLTQAVTASGDGSDCATRVFGPKTGVYEDPVTGSTHCLVAPYWAKRLGKSTINARQVSKRGGTLLCEVLTDGRIDISGRCELFAKSTIFIPWEK